MADDGLVVGFGVPTRGREQAAVKVFNELAQYLGAQQARNNVESFEPVLLQAHGGDLGGLFLIRGERESSDRMVASEFDKLVARSLFVVEHFGVVNAALGGRVEKILGVFQQGTADLRS